MNRSLHIFNYFFITMFGVMAAAALLSCGKANNNLPAKDLPKLNLVYLSPDGFPVSVYLGNIKLNNSTYRYTGTSGYFALNYIGQQSFVVRSAGVSNVILDTINAVTNPNMKYTLIETGLVADAPDTAKLKLKHIFLTDTASTPFVGRGKVRFVNASPRSGSFDVTANGTAAFKNIAFGKYSRYVEMPAGTYNFQIYQAGNSNTVLYNLPRIAVADGGLYSIYTYGLLGHTDTASFAAAVITNR